MEESPETEAGGAGEQAGWRERIWWAYGALDQSAAAVWTACGLLVLDVVLSLVRARSIAPEPAAWLPLLARLALVFFLFQGHPWARLVVLVFLVLALIVRPPVVYLASGELVNALSYAVLSAALIVLLTGRGDPPRVIAAGLVGLVADVVAVFLSG